MATSSGKKDYPPRLYPEGRSPLQKKSFYHNCKLSEFGKMREAVGDDAYFDILNNSHIGVLLKLALKSYTWYTQTVHHLVTNQLAVKRKYEMWTLIGGRPLRFSLHEYAHITGMNCDPIDVDNAWDIDHKDFWAELGVKPNEGPSYKELIDVFGCNSRCSVDLFFGTTSLNDGLIFWMSLVFWDLKAAGYAVLDDVTIIAKDHVFFA